jgi:hypothetical protein
MRKSFALSTHCHSTVINYQRHATMLENIHRRTISDFENFWRKHFARASVSNHGLFETDHPRQVGSQTV